MEEHSKEFLEKLKGLLAFAKEHKNAGKAIEGNKNGWDQTLCYIHI